MNPEQTSKSLVVLAGKIASNQLSKKEAIAEIAKIAGKLNKLVKSDMDEALAGIDNLIVKLSKVVKSVQDEVSAKKVEEAIDTFKEMKTDLLAKTRQIGDVDM